MRSIFLRSMIQTISQYRWSLFVSVALKGSGRAVCALLYRRNFMALEELELSFFDISLGLKVCCIERRSLLRLFCLCICRLLFELFRMISQCLMLRIGMNYRNIWLILFQFFLKKRWLFWIFLHLLSEHSLLFSSIPLSSSLLDDIVIQKFRIILEH